MPDALVASGIVPLQALLGVRHGGWDDGPMTSPEPLVCSAKGCQREADWALLWNNPKLHTPERRKVWLACELHRSTLGDFLTARAFLRDVVPADAAPEPS